jgi:pimeloyl-ACP methyl ester carboxylesterase
MSVDEERRNNFWHSHTDSDTVIVFVHGICADSRTCWLHHGAPSGKDVFWPDLIAGDQRFGHLSIFLAGYYTGLEAGDFPMAQCAREVLDALKRPEIDGTPPPMQSKQIIFVCHSTGGIVVRYMLESHRELFVDKAIGLALIASPSLGSGWANLASFAAKYYNQRLGQQLRWDDRELEDLHWRFRELVNQKEALMPSLFGMEAAEHTMIFRDRIPRWIRWARPPRLKVVTTLSAGQYFGAVKILPGTNHFTAVKPDTVHHPAHEFLVDFVNAFNASLRRRQPPSTKVATASTIAQPVASSESVPTAEDLDSAWPAQSHETVFGFVSEAGFAPASSVAVLSYVAVEDLTDLERRFEATLADIAQDPYFRALPSITTAIKARRIDYQAVDVEVRARIAELLATLVFEAYVCFSRVQRQAQEKQAMESGFGRLRDSASHI